MTRKEQLRHMVTIIDKSPIGSLGLDEAIVFAKDRGIVANMHVGKSQEWFEEDRNNRVAEWIMGQFVDGYENNQYIGYNSGINIAMSFLEGKY